MMDPKDLKKLLFQLQRVTFKQKYTDLDTKLQISMLFDDAMECADYRIPKAPIVLDDNGHEFKCPKCGTVFDSPESHVGEYGLCYICGQLWKDHTKFMKEFYGENTGKEKIVNTIGCKTDSKTEYKPEYGRKKKRRKR